MTKILVLHGPNLQLLGERRPDLYGRTTLDQINGRLRQIASQRGVMLETVQSNHEGQLVDLIGRARRGGCAGILINPAAYTHTSVAIRDAIEGCGLPAVEVHLSNICAREPFRQHSLSAGVCRGQVAGFGPSSYRWGLEALLELLEASEEAKERPAPPAAAAAPRPAAAVRPAPRRPATRPSVPRNKKKPPRRRH